MVSTDPRQSSLAPDFRVSAVQPWTEVRPLPVRLPIVRGGPSPAPAGGTGQAGILRDEAGTPVTDEAGGMLA